MLLLIVIFQRLQLPLYSTYHMIGRSRVKNSENDDILPRPHKKSREKKFVIIVNRVARRGSFRLSSSTCLKLLHDPNLPKHDANIRFQADFRDSIILRSVVIGYLFFVLIE